MFYKVSVIVPVCNSEKYLKKCLDTICNQTLKDIEIICVNDCSTDNSLEILKEYAAKDIRIKIINFSENKGAGAARNAAIEQASGQYIGFVDSDDFIDLDFYEKLYNKAVETNSDAVKGTLLLYDNHTKKSYLEEWIDINPLIKNNKAYFFFNFTTAIFNKNFINKHEIRFPQGLVHFEDPCFTIKAAIFYSKLELVDDAQYYYTNNENSQSRKKHNEKQVKSLINGANIALELLNNNNVTNEHYMIVVNFILQQILAWCNHSNIKLVKIAADGLIEIFKKCKYKENLIQYHFIAKSEEHRAYIIRQLKKKMQKRALC